MGMCFVSTLATGAARSLTVTARKSPATAKAEMGIDWTRPKLATAFTGGELLEGQSVSRLECLLLREAD